MKQPQAKEYSYWSNKFIIVNKKGDPSIFDWKLISKFLVIDWQEF